VSEDIDAALAGWAFKPAVVQARRVEASDGRDVLQLRLDLGVMQLEMDDRPDGDRPHGHPTYYAFLKAVARREEAGGRGFVLDAEQCVEADREFMQFYHRRVCWMALGEYARAVADADHTLAFMDFVRDHSPGEEFTRAHEQYRGFVIYQRTQAAVAARAEADDADGAIHAVRQGAEAITAYLAEFDPEADPESDQMLIQLGKLEADLRSAHGVGQTLQEQLEAAVRAEDYEAAARLRDQIREQTELRTRRPRGA
jgi:hypothetical protein